MNGSKIIHPSPLLSQYVKHYWILNTNSSDAIQTTPSGCVHLVFHRGDNLHFLSGKTQPKNFIRGQFSNYNTLLSGGHIDMIAVIFHPLGLTPFASFPLSEIYNRYVDIESFEIEDLTNLQKKISNEENALLCVKLIEDFLISKVYNFNHYNYSRLFHGVQLIQEQVGINVSTLANKVCLGYRHFKREFQKYVGIEPKEYLRVIRFQKTLYTLQNNPNIDMGELAYLCGFYDNSHLVKDFKSMTGCSPTEYLSSRSPHSIFFSDYSRLNLIKK